MNELPSADFRSQYAKLTEPTLVTVHGHIIGTWLPVGTAMDPVIATSPTIRPESYAQPQRAQTDDFAKLPGGGVQARQAQRDALLSKINRPK